VGLERQWIQAATIAVDSETGAILVTGITGDGGGVAESIQIKNAAGTPINPATLESVAAVASALGGLASQATLAEVAARLLHGSDGAAKLLADILTKLSADPATQTTLAALLAELEGGGVPVAGVGATGADSYATLVQTPARVCRHLAVQSGSGGDAVLSLDGGTSDSLSVPADAALALDGLRLAAGTDIQARNAQAGQPYTNLRISVW
jgi:hypothetical protein